MNDAAAGMQRVRFPAEGPVWVEFRIPADWKMAVGPPNVGMFYPESEYGGPSPLGGLLAVNVEAKSFPSPLSADAADAQVRAGAKDPSQVLRLGPERWVIRAKDYKQDLSHRNVVHVWVLVRLVRPDLLARVGFVFTAADTLYDGPGDSGYAMVDLLEREVEAARVGEG